MFFPSQDTIGRKPFPFLLAKTAKAGRMIFFFFFQTKGNLVMASGPKALHDLQFQQLVALH